MLLFSFFDYSCINYSYLLISFIRSPSFHGVQVYEDFFSECADGFSDVSITFSRFISGIIFLLSKAILLNTIALCTKSRAHKKNVLFFNFSETPGELCLIQNQIQYFFEELYNGFYQLAVKHSLYICWSYYFLLFSCKVLIIKFIKHHYNN